MIEGMRWILDSESLALLETSGSPFNAEAYRRAWTDSGLGWSDVSFGARAPDGTQAAIALLRRGMVAQSLPLGYGGVVASRPLKPNELETFLRTARSNAGVREIQARSVLISPTEADSAASRIATTSVLYFTTGIPVGDGLSKKAAQAIARARRAGGAAQPASSDPRPFLCLYLDASSQWVTRYPEPVLVFLAAAGLLKLFDVTLDGAVEASAAGLVGRGHWMYWLAAQSSAGRSAELGYLALAALLENAQAAGAAAVNLGASEGLPGVA
jgi:Acetyltransferase (GNAT) domain